MTTTTLDNHPVAVAAQRDYDLILDSKWDLHAIPEFLPVNPGTPRINPSSVYSYIKIGMGWNVAQRWMKGELSPPDLQNVSDWIVDIMRQNLGGRR